MIYIFYFKKSVDHLGGKRKSIACNEVDDSSHDLNHTLQIMKIDDGNLNSQKSKTG
jgi:hypothetical protein